MTDSEEILGKVIKAVTDENYDEAIEYLTNFLDSNPKHANAWFMLGEIYVIQEDYPKAQVCFIKTVENNPEKSARAWIRLGDIYMEYRNFEQAIKAYTQATEDESDNFHAWQHLGLVHVYVDKDKAIEILHKALELNPEDVLTLSSIGTLYDIQKNHDKAIEFCEKALEFETEDLQTMRVLGTAYFRRGDREKGIKIIRKTLEIDDSFIEGLITLGTFLNQMGENEEADKILKKAEILRGL
ncbi:MAG TPA: tetratricopeptide repeat protein [candidate division Zixibacteria bacterium]|nr:tetratricopeptide repeat protein [candidate division Zixibacteria bacterium]